MTLQRVARKWARGKREQLLPRLEALEDRTFLSTTSLFEPPSLLDPATQPRFVNPLPIPGVLRPVRPNGRYYEVSISQFQQPLGLYDAQTGTPLKTTVWGYNGSYPGPTIEAQKDQRIKVLWKNDLVDGQGRPLPHLLPVDTSIHWAAPGGWPESGVPVVTHLHGGHNESASDGLPEAWFTPGFQQKGPDWVKTVYRYDNTQEAATLWYHDHALGLTRLNVYAGLAGFYLLRDRYDTGEPDNPVGLPAGTYEVPLVIQDRMFTERGELFYPSEPEVEEPTGLTTPGPSVRPEFFGDVILVNGAAWPVLEVEPRMYRLRLLNGSDSRFYSLWITPGEATDFGSGPQMIQIGADGGLLDMPVPLMTQLIIGPGERADVLVDFSAWQGQTLILRNDAATPFPDGDPVAPTDPAARIIAFRVGTTVTSAANNEVPEALRPRPVEPLVQTGVTRRVALFEGEDEYGRLQSRLGTVDRGPLMWEDPVTENPRRNDVEVWEIYNTTEDTHPIHLHLVQFQILSRQHFTADVDEQTGVMSHIRLLGEPRPPAPNEAGRKDTVRVNPGEVVRIIAKFDRPGQYVWHCHILSHEDHEMMRPYYVGAIPGRRPRGAPRMPVTEASDPVLSVPAPRAVDPGAVMSATADPIVTATTRPLSVPAPIPVPAPPTERSGILGPMAAIPVPWERRRDR